MEKQAMSFGLVCQWLGMKAANAEDYTLCSLEIRAGDYTLTRNIAENSANISDSAVVSAWPLAAWLAWNWWRLLYETGPFRKSGLHVRPSVDWKRAHYLPAADYGYQWPRISLVSDENLSISIWLPILQTISGLRAISGISAIYLCRATTLPVASVIF